MLLQDKFTQTHILPSHNKTLLKIHQNLKNNNRILRNFDTDTNIYNDSLSCILSQTEFCQNFADALKFYAESWNTNRTRFFGISKQSKVQNSNKNIKVIAEFYLEFKKKKKHKSTKFWILLGRHSATTGNTNST
jgi:hypothetical protein